MDPTEDMLQEIINEVDPNQSGDIDIAQLMEVVHRILEDIWETVHGAFRAFDPNKTGFIRVNGLQRVVKCLGEDLTPEEVKNIFRSATAHKLTSFAVTRND